MIEFSHPARLLLAPAVALIFLLALPPRPHREVLTAYLPQWLHALLRSRRRPLRYPWLRTLLAAVAFLAAVAAFAGPRVPPVPGPQRLRVVVDASASLAADTGGGSAWSALRAALAGGLAGLPAHVRASVEVLRCDRLVRAVAPDALGEPAHTGLGMDLARAAVGALPEDTALWTLTDGRAPVPAVGALACFGAPADNLALVAFAVHDAWPLPDVELSVEVANFTARERVVDVRLAAAPGVLASVPEPVRCKLAPGAREAVAFAVRRAGGGEVVVALPGGDALAADDEVRCVLPPPPAPRIAVLSDSDAPVLRVAARALAEETGGDLVSATDDARASFVLVEGGAQPAAAWADLPGLTFGTALVAAGEAPAPPPSPAGAHVEWDRTEPLLRGLDLSELRVARLSSAVEGRPLVWNGGQPVVVARGRAVHCAFRLADSNLWLLPAFPQLLRRCYRAAHAETARVVVAPGLLDPEESDLRAAPPPDRPLPAFGAPPKDLSPWFLLAALGALLARVWWTRAP
ncbi:MAG TPA: hypothetical protein VK081_01990 [Planctomycetota bacterium]|nr:hypothetical protein [Planctomycetota bacterium]